MARMPEITGELQDEGTQEAENELYENQPAQGRVLRPLNKGRNLPGTIESPLLFRLIDYSGEGERAPPE